MNKKLTKLTYLLMCLSVLAGCKATTESYYPSPTQAGFSPLVVRSVCPPDYAVFTRAPSAAFPTSNACETARAAANACTVTIGTAPRAPCAAYCAANRWPCRWTIIIPTPPTITGVACYPDPPTTGTGPLAAMTLPSTYSFMCVATADCHCF